MSACERCWRDAHANPYKSTADEYRRLVAERGPGGCTPEEQAGPGAAECPTCRRLALHQRTGECMAGCPPPRRRREISGLSRERQRRR